MSHPPQPDQPAPEHWQQPYGAPSPYAPHLPRHPNAGTALALGIIGLVGSMIGIGLLVSPFAWFLGGRAVKEIDRYPGRWSGRDQAQAGRVMGIIGTVLLVICLVLIVLVIALIVALGLGGWLPTEPGGPGNVAV